MNFYLLWDKDRGVYVSKSWRRWEVNEDGDYTMFYHYSPIPTVYARLMDVRLAGTIPPQYETQEDKDKWWNDHYEIREFSADTYIVRARFEYP